MMIVVQIYSHVTGDRRTFRAMREASGSICVQHALRCYPPVSTRPFVANGSQRASAVLPASWMDRRRPFSAPFMPPTSAFVLSYPMFSLALLIRSVTGHSRQNEGKIPLDAVHAISCTPVGVRVECGPGEWRQDGREKCYAEMGIHATHAD